MSQSNSCVIAKGLPRFKGREYRPHFSMKGAALFTLYKGHVGWEILLWPSWKLHSTRICSLTTFCLCLTYKIYLSLLLRPPNLIPLWHLLNSRSSSTKKGLAVSEVPCMPLWVPFLYLMMCKLKRQVIFPLKTSFIKHSLYIRPCIQHLGELLHLILSRPGK